MRVGDGATLRKANQSGSLRLRCARTIAEHRCPSSASRTVKSRNRWRASRVFLLHEGLGAKHGGRDAGRNYCRHVDMAIRHRLAGVACASLPVLTVRHLVCDGCLAKGVVARLFPPQQQLISCVHGTAGSGARESIFSSTLEPRRMPLSNPLPAAISRCHIVSRRASPERVIGVMA